jgi:hypothetical protein
MSIIRLISKFVNMNFYIEKPRKKHPRCCAGMLHQEFFLFCFRVFTTAGAGTSRAPSGTGRTTAAALLAPFCHAPNRKPGNQRNQR